MPEPLCRSTVIIKQQATSHHHQLLLLLLLPFFFFQILFVFKLNRLVEAEPSPEIRHRINDVTTFSANLLVVVGKERGSSYGAVKVQRGSQCEN